MFLPLHNPFYKQKSNQFALILLLVCLGAIYKLNGMTVDQTLWAEDGVIFINQARQFELKAFFIPYNGYFHIYPRLIAWISQLVDLSYTPTIFFSAWLATYMTLAWLIADKVLAFGGTFIEALLLTYLILMQPHPANEIYFNITNLQWLTGDILALCLALPPSNKHNPLYYSAMGLGLLTGPFAILLIPMLILQLWFAQDWQARKGIYLLVLGCAFLQFMAIANSSRLGNMPTDTDLSHWLSAYFIFFSFGARTHLMYLAALVFWLCAVLVIYRYYFKIQHQVKADYLIPLYCVVSALFFHFAGLWALRFSPQTVNPNVLTARYFFIPYTLIGFGLWFISHKQPRLRNIIALAGAVLCIAAYTPFVRNDYQYQAFVAFARQQPNLQIPINPQDAAFPSWGIPLQGLVSGSKTLSTPEAVDIKRAELKNIYLSQDQNQTWITTTSDANQGLLSFPFNDCQSSRYVGIEIKLIRPLEGWIKMAWDGPKGSQMTKFYPSGEITAYFAFRNHAVKRIDFYPTDKKTTITWLGARFLCLE